MDEEIAHFDVLTTLLGMLLFSETLVNQSDLS